VTSSYISLEELLIEDSDPWTVFPKFEIAENVRLMGDYFDMDYSKMRSSTKLEVKADYYKI
jgi:hypothetical protein